MSVKHFISERSMRVPVVGERIYYTGDMANVDGWLTVTAVRDTDWGVSVDLIFDESDRMDAREEIKGLTLSSFQAGPGCRFIFEDVQKKARADMLTRLGA